MSTTEMNAAVNELKELLSMRSELDAEIKILEDRIKDHMSMIGADELRCGLYMVRYKEITSNRFDAKRFRADFPDIFEAYTHQTVNRRFTVA